MDRWIEREINRQTDRKAGRQTDTENVIQSVKRVSEGSTKDKICGEKENERKKRYSERKEQKKREKGW